MGSQLVSTLFDVISCRAKLFSNYVSSIPGYIHSEQQRYFGNVINPYNYSSNVNGVTRSHNDSGNSNSNSIQLDSSNTDSSKSQPFFRRSSGRKVGATTPTNLIPQINYSGLSNLINQSTILSTNRNQSKLNATSSSNIQLDDLVLWKNPILTLNFCFAEILLHLNNASLWLTQRKEWFGYVALLWILFSIPYWFKVTGYYKFINGIFDCTWYYGYWFVLGVLSSIGIGTGMHTYILYLGPHIARITLAAHECHNLEFIVNPKTNTIKCKHIPWYDLKSRFYYDESQIRVSNIYRIVCLESLFWGLGTAVGELPAYLLGKTIRLIRPVHKKRRLSHIINKVVDLDPVAPGLPTIHNQSSSIGLNRELQIKYKTDATKLNTQIGVTSLAPNGNSDLRAEQITPGSGVRLENGSNRGIDMREGMSFNYGVMMKSFIRIIVSQLGFLGILLCASIPNPFFDVVGLACGHAIIPFWKFFLALLLGKMLIKAQIQSLALVALLSEEQKKPFLSNYIHQIPKYGGHIYTYLQESLAILKERSLGTTYKARLANNVKMKSNNSSYKYDIDGRLRETFITLCLVYFIVNLINSLAQANYGRNQDIYEDYKNGRK